MKPRIIIAKIISAILSIIIGLVFTALSVNVGLYFIIMAATGGKENVVQIVAITFFIIIGLTIYNLTEPFIRKKLLTNVGEKET
jgi:hypothetical protein